MDVREGGRAEGVLGHASLALEETNVQLRSDILCFREVDDVRAVGIDPQSARRQLASA